MGNTFTTRSSQDGLQLPQGHNVTDEDRAAIAAFSETFEAVINNSSSRIRTTLLPNNDEPFDKILDSVKAEYDDLKNEQVNLLAMSHSTHGAVEEEVYQMKNTLWTYRRNQLAVVANCLYAIEAAGLILNAYKDHIAKLLLATIDLTESLALVGTMSQTAHARSTAAHMKSLVDNYEKHYSELIQDLDSEIKKKVGS